MQRAFVTGAAGFIGSNLVDRLLQSGVEVVGWDNYSTGQEPFLAGAIKEPKFRFVRGDNLDQSALTQAMEGCDFVFHLAANADVRFGLEHPSKPGRFAQSLPIFRKDYQSEYTNYAMTPRNYKFIEV